MNKKPYLTVIENNLKYFAGKLCLLEEDWMFQQDNNTKHTAHIL